MGQIRNKHTHEEINQLLASETALDVDDNDDDELVSVKQSSLSKDADDAADIDDDDSERSSVTEGD